jgi:hypothetical protein
VTRADSSRLSRRLLDPGLDSTTGYQQLCKISAGKYLLRVPVSMLEKCDDQQSQRGTGCSFPYSAHVAPFTYGPRCQSGQRFARIDLPRRVSSSGKTSPEFRIRRVRDSRPRRALSRVPRRSCSSDQLRGIELVKPSSRSRNARCTMQNIFTQWERLGKLQGFHSILFFLSRFIELPSIFR